MRGGEPLVLDPNCIGMVIPTQRIFSYGAAYLQPPELQNVACGILDFYPGNEHKLGLLQAFLAADPTITTDFPTWNRARDVEDWMVELIDFLAEELITTVCVYPQVKGGARVVGFGKTANIGVDRALALAPDGLLAPRLDFLPRPPHPSHIAQGGRFLGWGKGTYRTINAFVCGLLVAAGETDERRLRAVLHDNQLGLGWVASEQPGASAARAAGMNLLWVPRGLKFEVLDLMAMGLEDEARARLQAYRSANATKGNRARGLAAAAKARAKGGTSGVAATFYGAGLANAALDAVAAGNAPAARRMVTIACSELGRRGRDGFIGVERSKDNISNPWRAQLGGVYNIGSFETEELAAQSYDGAAYRDRGAGAALNFSVERAIAASPDVEIYPPKLRAYFEGEETFVAERTGGPEQRQRVARLRAVTADAMAAGGGATGAAGGAGPGASAGGGASSGAAAPLPAAASPPTALSQGPAQAGGLLSFMVPTPQPAAGSFLGAALGAAAGGGGGLSPPPAAFSTAAAASSSPVVGPVPPRTISSRPTPMPVAVPAPPLHPDLVTLADLFPKVDRERRKRVWEASGQSVERAASVLAEERPSRKRRSRHNSFEGMDQD